MKITRGESSQPWCIPPRRSNLVCSGPPTPIRKKGDKKERTRREGVLDRRWGKRRRKEERRYQERKVSPKGSSPLAKPTILLLLAEVSRSLPHPRDVHFCSLARLQGQRNMGWSARKWRNYIRGREKGGCKSKRPSLSPFRCSREMKRKERICYLYGREGFGRTRRDNIIHFRKKAFSK